MDNNGGVDPAIIQPSHTSTTTNSTSKPNKRKRSNRKRSSAPSKTSKTTQPPPAPIASSTNDASGTKEKATKETATAVTENQDEEEEEEDAPRKRGHKGNFQGARLKFLEASLQDYVKAKPRGPCFSRISSQWFDKWPWHENDKQPERFDVLDSEDSTLSAEARAELLEERKNAQDTVQSAGKQQLERWFWRNAKKATPAVPLQSTPLAPLLRKALGFSGGAPRRSTLYKFWMRKPENKPKVQEAVQARLAKEVVEKSMLLKLRCEVAEALFEDEPEEVKQDVEERVEEIYQQQLELFKKITTGEPVSLEELGEGRNAEELREICRESLTKFLQPLLDLLRLYTGLKFCLLGGAPPSNDDDDFFLLIINSGETTGLNPQTFQNWHNEYFTKNVMALFMLFLCNQDPKELLGDPGIIHPDSNGASSNVKATTAGSSLDDPTLISMAEPDSTRTRPSRKQRKRRRTTKHRRRTRGSDSDRDDDSASSSEDEVTFRDENGKVVYLSDMKGRVIETRQQDLVIQHFEAESTPEPDRPLPDVVKLHLASILTESRRDIIGMLNSQTGIVWDHNVEVLTREAEVWKAGLRPIEPESSIPSASAISSRDTHTNPVQAGSESLGSTLPSRSSFTRVPGFRHASESRGDTNMVLENIYQLEDHELRLSSSTNLTSNVRPPVRFGSVPACLPDGGNLDMSWLPSRSGLSKTPPVATDISLNSSQRNDIVRSRPKPKPLPRRARVTSSPLTLTPPAASSSNESSNLHVASSNETSAASQSQNLQEQVDLDNCPSWLTKAIAALGGLEQDIPEWNKTLQALVTLERSYDFDDPSGRTASFSAAKGVRPSLVEWFFKNRKNVEATLKHDFDITAKKLGEDIGKWWSVINPEWRERDRENRIVPGGEGEGTWDGVHKPGQCGMITVLVCIRWWFLRAKDDNEEMAKCLLLLSDVQAVLEDMAYERGAYDRRLKRKPPPSLASDETRPLRRTRAT
ncbi:hypothetical protein EV360DRAFT_86057 [Lentinula raphanica]|nr:hypothetical protein EV360DRAFT_86057 [Lentinula raphanica]